MSKTDLLWWDQIAIVGLERKMARLEKSDPPRFADLEFLIDHGVVSVLPATLGELDEYLADLGAGRVRVATELTIRHGARVDERAAELREGFEQFIAACERESKGWWSVPIIDRRSGHSTDVGQRPAIRVLDLLPTMVEEKQVIDLIARHLPVPGPNVPLEQVLDFRAEQRTQAQLARLRKWMTETIDELAGGESITTIEARLEAHRADFREHMYASKMEARVGQIRALMSIPRTVGKLLLGLGKREVADGLSDGLSLMLYKAQILQAEREAPGGTLAYLDTAHESYASR